jgi:hypothetical protein
MSPIVAIEQILRSEDRARSIVFFLFFARFEYALKRAGFVRTQGAKADALADWTKYARSDVASLLTENNEERFQEAVALLQSEPPIVFGFHWHPGASKRGNRRI